jgi:hypothetical protein
MPNLWRGDKGEGGVTGFVDLMNGLPTQGKNAYLQKMRAKNVDEIDTRQLFSRSYQN